MSRRRPPTGFPPVYPPIAAVLAERDVLARMLIAHSVPQLHEMMARVAEGAKLAVAAS